MRPHDPKRRSKSAALGRARMYLKSGLPWIRGYPAGKPSAGALPWVVMPPPGTKRAPEQVTLTRESLREAQLAQRKLKERCGRTMARLVDDPRAWHAGVTLRIAALKAAIHDGERLPPPPGLWPDDARPQVAGLAQRLVRSHRRLAPLVTALTWIHADDPPSRRAAIRLVSRQPDRLQRLVDLMPGGQGLPAAVRLVELGVADGEAAIAPLARVLADPRAWEVPLADAGQLAGVVQKQFRKPASRPVLVWPDLPQPHLGRECCDFLDTLARTPQAARRRMWRLLALVLPQGSLERWASWWKRARTLMGEVDRRAAPYMPESGRAGALRALHAKIDRLERRSPPAFAADAVLAAVRDSAADTADTKLFREMVAALRRMPEAQGQHGVRAGFLLHWQICAEWYPKGRPILRRAVRATAALFRDGRLPERVLFLWSNVADRRVPTQYDANRSPEGQLSQGTLPASALAPVYDAVQRVAWGDAGGKPVPIHDYERWWSLLYLVQACGEGAAAVRWLRVAMAAKLTETIWNNGLEACRAVVAMAGDDADRFVGLVRALAEHGADALTQLAVLVSRTEQGALIGDWILGGSSARAVACAARYHLLHVLGAGRRARLPKPGASTRTRTKDWMGRYPAALRGGLRRLAAVADDARDSADDLLGKAWPDPVRLRTEIRALEQRLSESAGGRVAAMRKRLAALRRRLAQPKPVSPARLRNLARKLEHRVREATLAAWEQALDRALDVPLARLMGGAVPAPWRGDAPRLRLMASLAGLEPAFRTLAFKLLRVRGGEPPWDLRDHPANRAWIGRMTQRGLDPQPWIEGPPPRTVTGPGGRPVTLAFADDPWDVFRMGEPFQTCLSPGDFNFFSTVANAADLNKRVLFARFDDGAVAGRCLLAVTKAGQVLTFNAYAHDHEWGFKAAVGEWADDLARAMGTRVVPAGEVDHLVANDWYDDGPEDLTGRFKFLEPGSPFRQELKELEPSALRGRIDQELAPDTLDPITLPLILELHELEQRPALIVPLLPVIEAAANLSPERVLVAANQAVRAGASGAARTLLRRLAGRPVWRGDNGHWLATRMAKALVQVGRPMEALRVLRLSRPRYVRSWEQEPYDDRVFVAARAQDLLHRPAAAWALYDRLARARYPALDESERDLCKTRARELGELLGRR